MEARKAGHENSCVVDKGAVAFHSTDSLLLDITTVNIYCWDLESPRSTLPVLTKIHHLPQSNGQQMRQQQRWKKNLQKVCWENAPFLHNTCISHAECSCSLRVFKKELPGVERNYQSMCLSSCQGKSSWYWKHLLGGDIFWPTWPVPYPIRVFLQDAFNFSSSLNIVFLRLRKSKY